MAEHDIAPDADVAEQQAAVDGDEPAEEHIASVGDRPEADVLEQSRSVHTEQAARHPDLGAEIPEADAWEQAMEVPLDDERD
jgi:hypothetical protein